MPWTICLKRIEKYLLSSVRFVVQGIALLPFHNKGTINCCTNILTSVSAELFLNNSFRSGNKCSSFQVVNNHMVGYASEKYLNVLFKGLFYQVVTQTLSSGKTKDFFPS